MSSIKTAIAIASVIAQIVGLISVPFLVYDLTTIPDSLMEQANRDTELVNQYLYETVASYRNWFGAGVIAAFIGWLLILKGEYRVTWFLRTSRVLAWSWMPFIPVGTIVGVLVLSARAAAIADEESQP